MIDNILGKLSQWNKFSNKDIAMDWFEHFYHIGLFAANVCQSLSLIKTLYCF